MPIYAACPYTHFYFSFYLFVSPGPGQERAEEEPCQAKAREPKLDMAPFGFPKFLSIFLVIASCQAFSPATAKLRTFHRFGPPSPLAQKPTNLLEDDGYTELYKPLGLRLLNVVTSPLKQIGQSVRRRTRRNEPGTLILVRHDESNWNQNRTFTGEPLPLPLP